MQSNPRIRHTNIETVFVTMESGRGKQEILIFVCHKETKNVLELNFKH
jgi:hypothetical protein